MTNSDRPYMLGGASCKMKVESSAGEFSVYMNVNYDENDDPYEVFINCKRVEYAEHMTALTILISSMLREGIPLEVIAEDLMSIQSPVTSHYHNGERVTSLHARIGKALMGMKKYPAEVAG